MQDTLTPMSSSSHAFISSLPSTPHAFINSRLLRQHTGSHLKRIKEHAAKASKRLLIEREFNLSHTFDKIFSSLWLSPFEIVCGTKDCRLVLLNTLNHKSSEIEFQKSGLDCGKGIYAFAVNEAKSLIAVAPGYFGEWGFAVMVYSFPEFSLRERLVGHFDTVFGVEWIDDNSLVSCARDATFRFWCVKAASTELETVKDILAIKISSVHRGKIRNLSPVSSGESLTLSSDGTVKLWDLNTFTPILTKHLTHTNELIALTTTPNSAFVGSQSHITRIDFRTGDEVEFIDSLDEGWGVRCLEYNNDVVSVGGGLGRISFYDVRACKYISWQDGVGDTSHHNSGEGHLVKNSSYETYHRGSTVKHGICTMAYNESHSSLFTGGGPIQLNLCGSYAAIW